MVRAVKRPAVTPVVAVVTLVEAVVVTSLQAAVTLVEAMVCPAALLHPMAPVSSEPGARLQ